MTKCNLPNGLFQSVKGRKCNIDFNGGNVSSDAGLLPLAELDKRLHLTVNTAAVLKPCGQRVLLLENAPVVVRRTIWIILSANIFMKKFTVLEETWKTG